MKDSRVVAHRRLRLFIERGPTGLRLPLRPHCRTGAKARQQPSGLAVVGILSRGGPERGEPGYDLARENPTAGTGRETGCQQPVVDLARDRKAVEAPR